MERIIDYYTESLFFHHELYIYCCEYYDLELLSEESYDMFIYDQILYGYNQWCKNIFVNDIWKDLADIEVKEIKIFLKWFSL